MTSVKDDRFWSVYFMMPFASQATINESFGIYLKHWHSGRNPVKVYPLLVPASDLNFAYENTTPLMRAAMFNAGDLTADLLYRNACLSIKSMNGTAISMANNLGSYRFLDEVIRYRKINDVQLSVSDELILDDYIESKKPKTIVSGNDNFVSGNFSILVGATEEKKDLSWWSLLWG